jgi:hypothetical protein
MKTPPVTLGFISHRVISLLLRGENNDMLVTFSTENIRRMSPPTASALYVDI